MRVRRECGGRVSGCKEEEGDDVVVVDEKGRLVGVVLVVVVVSASWLNSRVMSLSLRARRHGAAPRTVCMGMLVRFECLLAS